MSAQQTYPKRMVHAAYWPGKVAKTVTDETGKISFPKPNEGLPARFPPVFVMNEDQEEYHKSRGYTVAATNDVRAFQGAIAGVNPDHQPVEYPMWVGTTLVKDREEHERLMAGGGTLKRNGQEIVAPAPTPADIEKDQLRAENERLKAQLEALQGGAKAEPEAAQQASARANAAQTEDLKAKYQRGEIRFEDLPRGVRAAMTRQKNRQPQAA